MEFEVIFNRLQNLDNVQLRTELLKHGEKVGPVTPTTRKVFLSKLANKIYLSEHPEANAGSVDSDSSCVDRGGGESNASLAEKSQANEEKEEASTYFVVIQNGSGIASPCPTVDSNANQEHRVFTEKVEALAFMKKNAGSRLKIFHSAGDVKQFLTMSAKQTDEKQRFDKYQGTLVQDGGSNNSSSASDADKSAFKGPKIQDLVQFRKLVEKGDVAAMKDIVWSNPRYLITSADTPVILHEGMRHNALHIAAKWNQAAAAQMVLDTVQDLEFTTLLYSSSHDTQQSRQQRILYLMDLYLNSPDKGSAESPLHIACKMGHAAMVRTLVMFSATDRTRCNKFGENPEDIICSRYQGDQSKSIKGEIHELLKGLCLVPLLRSHDNATLPVVGEPCSPDSRAKVSAPTSTLDCRPRDPQLTLSAYAGPMSPSKARDFHKQWMHPRRLWNSPDAREMTSARKEDAEKGYERIGRKLARELHVPWTEYWQFLDAFADFSTQDGLTKLQQHLDKQLCLLGILAAMRSCSTSSEDEVSGNDAEESGNESAEELYFSCDEDSTEQGVCNSYSVGKSVKRTNLVGEGDDDDDDDRNDIFEDSLDNFFDSRPYFFGQRLQLKKKTEQKSSSNAQPNSSESKASGESVNGNTRKTQLKIIGDNSCLWSYRDNPGSGEEVNKPSENSLTEDATHSFDEASPVDQAKAKQSQTGHAERGNTARQASTETLDKSFNTLMGEISEELEAKLIFSPEGLVVRSKRKSCLPDIGLCLDSEHKIFSRGLCKARRKACPLNIVVKSKKGKTAFLADVLILDSDSSFDSDDDSSDSSSGDILSNSKRSVMTDVTVVVKSALISKHVWRTVRPIHVTVGLLESGSQDITTATDCIDVRMVRRKNYKSRQTACYIYGSRPCKTDLDVVRAMCDCNVDPVAFPRVHSWLSLISATQEGKENWPSPARLRHQHRLSQLQNRSLNSSPISVSPLVQSGTITSTPVSRPRGSLSSVRLNCDLSPERPALKFAPKAWLFKSPPAET